MLMTKSLASTAISGTLDIVAALRCRREDIYHVSVDAGDLCSCLDSLQTHPSTPQALRIEAAIDGCYMVALLRGALREMVFGARRFRVVDGLLHEIGDSPAGSAAGFMVSARCTLAVPIDDGDAAAACGHLVFR